MIWGTWPWKASGRDCWDPATSPWMFKAARNQKEPSLPAFEKGRWPSAPRFQPHSSLHFERVYFSPWVGKRDAQLRYWSEKTELEWGLWDASLFNRWSEESTVAVLTVMKIRMLSPTPEPWDMGDRIGDGGPDGGLVLNVGIFLSFLMLHKHFLSFSVCLSFSVFISMSLLPPHTSKTPPPLYPLRWLPSYAIQFHEHTYMHAGNHSYT